MKKRLFALLSATAVLALAGCGPNGEGEGEKKGHFTHSVTIKLVHTTGQANRETLQQIADEFMEMEPYVTVDLESGLISGNYSTIHSTTINDFQTGEYGDLVVGYGDHAADYLDYGKLVQLDAFMDNPEYGFTQEEKDDLIAGFMTEGQSLAIPGTWMLPYSKSSEAMFYNKDKLIGRSLSKYDASINGGNPLTEDYICSLTWEEMFEHLLPALKAYDAEHKDAPLLLKLEDTDTPCAYLGYDSTENLFITLSQQYELGYTSMDSTGNATLDFNTPEMKAVVKTFADAAKEGYIAAAGFKNNNSYCSSYFTAQNELFCIGSTAGVKNQNSSDFQVGIAPVPHAAGHEAKIISQGPGMCILDHGDADRQLASWLFYKYLTNSENSARWATETGYIPVRQSSYADEYYMAACDISGKAARSLDLLKALNATYCASISDYFFSTPSFKGSTTARTQVGSIMLNALKDAHNGTNVNDSYLNNLFNTAYNNILNDM